MSRVCWLACRKSQTPGLTADACEVEGIPSGGSITATLVATPIANPAKSERKFTNTAFIQGSGTTDPNSGNDSASLSLHISGKIP